MGISIASIKKIKQHKSLLVGVAVTKGGWFGAVGW